MDQRGDDFTVHPQALSTVIDRAVLSLFHGIVAAGIVSTRISDQAVKHRKGPQLLRGSQEQSTWRYAICRRGALEAEAVRPKRLIGIPS